MKKTILLVLMLGSLSYFLSSCKDKSTDCCDNPNTDKSCKLASQEENGVLINYHYSAGVIIMATGQFGDTTYFDYSGAGVLSTATNNQGVKATFEYNGSDIPSKVNIIENGQNAYYFAIASSNNVITQVRTYAHGTTTNPMQEINVNYNGSQMQSFELKVEDGQGGLINFIEADSIETDGKLNPLRSDFAITYMNFENPFAFGNSNIIDADILVIGTETPMSANYTYNDQDYVIESDIKITGADRLTKFTYNCE